jgi:hypothetical protein
MKRLSFATAIAGLLMTGAAIAADSYDIDPTHAWVRFETNHAGWSQAQGAFKAVSGTIAFDKEDVTKSTVEIVLEAASIDTNDEKRDTHLKSPDFLNAEEFPQITFKSTAIEKTGDKTAKVTGDLTLLESHPAKMWPIQTRAHQPREESRKAPLKALNSPKAFIDRPLSMAARSRMTALAIVIGTTSDWDSPAGPRETRIW